MAEALTFPRATREAVTSLAQTADTPLYAFDVAGVRERLAALVSAFEERFPNVTAAYSYKTNSARFVTQLVRAAGQAAEVVSGAELRLALADGFSPNRIYFDGPVKRRDELALGIDLGVRIQLDSWPEVHAVCDLAERGTGPRPRVSLRGSARRRRRWSRFGFTPGELDAATRCLRAAGIAVSGLHVNLGTQLVDPAAYGRGLRPWRREIIALVDRHCGADPFVLDVGGGFPARSARPGIVLPPWTAQAEAIHRAVTGMGLTSDAVHLVVEPGRSLVEDSGYLVCRVVAEKRRRRRRILVADGSGLLVSSRATWHHPITLHPTGPQAYDVYGSACFEHDVIATRVAGPDDIAPDQLVVVGSAGGYDIPSARGWTRPLPTVWVIDGDAAPLAVDPGDCYNELRLGQLPDVD